MDARILLRRAVDAEEQLESARARIAELEATLRAAIGRDPEEYRALDQRLIAADSLLIELKNWLHDNPGLADVMPDGFRARLRGQTDAAKGSDFTLAPVRWRRVRQAD